MSKKEKGIHYGEVGLSTLDLLKKIDAEDEKQRELARIKQAAIYKELNANFAKEKELMKTISIAKKIVEKMQTEYLEFESRIGKEKLAETKKGALRQKDVLAGKASLRDFVKRGKQEDEILIESIEKTGAELERGLEAIHKKGEEILELEKLLGEVRNLIRGFLIQPLRLRQESLKTLKEFTEEQIGGYQSEMEGYRVELEQTKIKLQLAKKGVSLSRGYTWDSMTPIEAQKLIFSPLIPLDVIPKLRIELEKYKNVDVVSVSYFWRNHEIDVRPYYKPLSQEEKAELVEEAENFILQKQRIK